MSDLDRAREALLKAAVEHCDERDKAYAAMLRGVLADFDSVDRTRAAVLYAADAYARVAREEGEKHGK